MGKRSAQALIVVTSGQVTEVMAPSHTSTWISVRVRSGGMLRPQKVVLQFGKEVGLEIGVTEGRIEHSHSYTLIWAVVPKSSSLLLEDNEVPNRQERVLGNVEVEEFRAGEGAEGAELSGGAGGVIRQEKASWGAEGGQQKAGAEASPGGSRQAHLSH